MQKQLQYIQDYAAKTAKEENNSSPEPSKGELNKKNLAKTVKKINEINRDQTGKCIYPSDETKDRVYSPYKKEQKATLSRAIVDTPQKIVPPVHKQYLS